MMRHFTEEEEKLLKKLDNKNLLKEEREKIIERLKEIDREQTYPFSY